MACKITQIQNILSIPQLEQSKKQNNILHHRLHEFLTRNSQKVKNLSSYLCSLPSGEHIYQYPQLDHLDLYYKVNNREITLKLLSTIRIVEILEKTMINVEATDTPINMLPLPHQLCIAIDDEYEYQRDLYFTSFVEPMITYTYPNEGIIHHNYSWY